MSIDRSRVPHRTLSNEPRDKFLGRTRRTNSKHSISTCLIDHKRYSNRNININTFLKLNRSLQFSAHSCSSSKASSLARQQRPLIRRLGAAAPAALAPQSVDLKYSSPTRYQTHLQRPNNSRTSTLLTQHRLFPNCPFKLLRSGCKMQAST